MGSADAGEPAISVKNLRVSYGDREILHGISFDVRQGETMVILGGSGSGKSTLLRTLVGLEKASDGEVWIKGVNIARISEREMDAIRKKVGMSFQGSALFGSLTVGENVALPCASTPTWKTRPSRSWSGSSWGKLAWRTSNTLCLQS